MAPSIKEHTMNKSRRDMTLTDALSDPLIRTVMAADGVDPGELAAILHTIAGKLERSSLHIAACGAPPERDHFTPGPKSQTKMTHAHHESTCSARAS
ncbi:MAG: hypothetical protein AUI16_13705 [Alphaproteobacteria bacterium 13_2_20CM_2_64_7]|jgi:hypothetical protein|nr:MAG: hypothetical protein AUI16_13705 [Alphaproteobacteria bacterium 13_2_20CM_2_64_7]